MRILHVSLGLPPLRTGGLTRYCTELMEAQADRGHQIALLYPGRFLHGQTRIRSKKIDKLITFEVINPLPVPLTYGVSEPIAFMTTCDNPDAYKLCIQEFDPDVIHVHSFQGIHKEFFDIAKGLGVPTLFVTHDYFPFCPRCTLVNRYGKSCNGPSSDRCAMCCNDTGMTLRKSRIMQSGAYSRLKQSRVIRIAGSYVKRNMMDSAEPKDIPDSSLNAVDAYRDYLDYNRAIFEDIDIVASNTHMTECVYKTYFPEAHYKLVPITHKGLASSDDPKPPRDNNAPFKMAYFGGVKSYKGFATLREAARVLHRKGFKFSLDLYGDDYPALSDIPEAQGYGRVAPESMRGILRAHDVVVVPSICHETCGFVVLEALCEHVPVVCSDAVGASELIPGDFVFRAGDVSDLIKKLEYVNGELGSGVSIPEDYPIGMDEQVRLLEDIYSDLKCEVNGEAKQSANSKL